MGEKRLSILIPTLQKRSKLCQELTDELTRQLTTEVEFMLLPDAGQRTIGEKRNALLEAAQGDYVAFIDDDDMISPDYIDKVMKALEEDPDCASLTGFIYEGNSSPRTFVHSIDYEGWYTKDGIDYRYPNHLNAVKKKYALKVGFPEISHGEDRAYSDRIQQYLKKESKIEGVIYHYYPGGSRKK
jgi:glycosyltransferase involved in cell wall biosynthesis